MGEGLGSHKNFKDKRIYISHSSHLTFSSSFDIGKLCRRYRLEEYD